MGYEIGFSDELKKMLEDKSRRAFYDEIYAWPHMPPPTPIRREPRIKDINGKGLCVGDTVRIASYDRLLRTYTPSYVEGRIPKEAMRFCEFYFPIEAITAGGNVKLSGNPYYWRPEFLIRIEAAANPMADLEKKILAEVPLTEDEAKKIKAPDDKEPVKVEAEGEVNIKLPTINPLKIVL